MGSFFDNYRHEHLVFFSILYSWNGGVMSLSDVNSVIVERYSYDVLILLGTFTYFLFLQTQASGK